MMDGQQNEEAIGSGTERAKRVEKGDETNDPLLRTNPIYSSDYASSKVKPLAVPVIKVNCKIEY